MKAVNSQRMYCAASRVMPDPHWNSDIASGAGLVDSMAPNDQCYANSREVATTRVDVWLVRNDSTCPISLITQEENQQRHLLCQVTLYNAK